MKSPLLHPSGSAGRVTADTSELVMLVWPPPVDGLWFQWDAVCELTLLSVQRVEVLL